MRPARSFLRPIIGSFALGLGAAWSAAQVELPPLQTSGSNNRRTLERPPSYEPVRPATSVYSRSSSRGTSKIPDPSIFDGTDFPEEERPEQAMIAQFEMPGQQPQPATKNEQGPGQQQGAGGQGPGGDGGPQGGGGGPQLAGGPQIPGLPPLMGGGGGAQGQPGMPPMIPEGDQGDAGKPGGGEGEQGEQGEGGPAGAEGAEKAPSSAGQKGRALQAPSQIQIGDENAKLAEADLTQASASAQLENEQGENRMSVEAATGSQTSNRGTGTERGVDIPSNL
ncbi:MAG: hypothetical protein SynsKO_19350 [Synoicihabitans sp.]